MISNIRVVMYVFLVFILVHQIMTNEANAAVRVPHIFGNNMVLQRDIPLPIWGWAEPGETVSVQFGDYVLQTVANADGKWQVKLPALKIGEPRTLVISGKNRIVFENVLVGEVWLCSGQSNMEIGVAMCNNASQEIAEANYPELRLFAVDHAASGEPQSDCSGTWQVCNPVNIAVGVGGGFSAAAYFFGREIHRTLNVPVGLIQSAWGGSPIEPWMPPEGFALSPELKGFTVAIENADKKYRETLPAELDRLEKWIVSCEESLEAGYPVPFRPEWPKHPFDTSVIWPDFSHPTSLYNAMIYPLVPFAIRGVLWYQGESNVDNWWQPGEPDAYHTKYSEKMIGLIKGWRSVWNQGDLPFYYVQIAPYSGYGTLVKLTGSHPEDAVPLMWEAQAAVFSTPHTGMVGTLDISDINDIHPKNKQDIGKRLALWALAKTYDKTNIVCSGPMYHSMKAKARKIEIRFNNPDGGLASRDGKPLTWFTIAGQDKQFVEAQAEIKGNKVIVWSDSVPTPVAVRFAWNKIAEPNLINKEGLPAFPFRTDDW